MRWIGCWDGRRQWQNVDGDRMQLDLFGGKTDTRTRSFWETYLRSKEWRHKRDARLRAVGYRCQNCGASGEAARLEVHHLTYERLGNENPDDLRVLCPQCHKSADEARQVKEDRAAHWERMQAGFRTFCDKVYGEGWHDYPDEAWDKFEAWLDRRDE